MKKALTDSMTLVDATQCVSLQVVKENLTRANPAYATAVAFGRGFGAPKGIEKENTYFTLVPQGVLVPRNCPPDWFVNPLPTSTCEGRKLQGRFTGTLRDYQTAYFAENPLQRTNDKIMVAPCGHGKTVMGLFLACDHGRATLVLVPTNNLARQWELRIKAATDCTVAVWYANKKTPDFAVDFCVMTFELFLSRKPDAAWCAQWGHVMFDEAHRVGAPSFAPVSEVLPGKYRTALTATFRRHDRMEQILAYHFGPEYVLESQFPPAKVWELRTGCKVHDSCKVAKVNRYDELEEILSHHEISMVRNGDSVAFINPRGDSTGKSLKTVLLKAGVNPKHSPVINANKSLAGKIKGGSAFYDSWLSGDAERVKIMYTLLKRLLAEGRTVLFLSKRTKNLTVLHRLFKDVVPTVKVMGGVEKLTEAQEQFMQTEARLILGIVQLAKEGLDVERLDTLVCEHPLSDVEQAIGRIVRTMPGKKTPLAIFPQDVSGFYAGILTKGRRTLPTDTVVNGTFSLMELPKVLARV